MKLKIALLAAAMLASSGLWEVDAQSVTSVCVKTASGNCTQVSSTNPFPVDATVTGSNPAASATGSAVPADGSYNALNVGGTLRGQTGVNPTGSVFAGQMDLASIAGTVPALGNGTAANVLRVTLANDSTGLVTTAAIGTIGATAPTKADTFGWIDGSGNLQGVSAANPLPISTASLPLPSGAATAANQATEIASLSTIATNSGSAIPAGAALIGKVGIDQTTPGTTNGVTEVPATAGGPTVSTFEPGASDNHTVLKAGAGQIYWVTAFNNSATINYIRFYNATTGFNGCNSATNIVATMHIPANTSDAGFTWAPPGGVPFATGISYCVVGAYGQTSTTSATATAIDINIGYK